MKDKKKLSIIIGVSIYIIIGLVLVGVLLLTKRAAKEISEYHIKNESVYMFLGEERLDYITEITLNRHNNVTSMKIDGEEIELNSDPIYFKDKDEVIIPSDMGIVYPLEGIKQKKASYYSKLVLQDNKVLLTVDDLKYYKMSNTFLYDGNDLYFFCDDVTISIDDELIKIPAFSYVIAQYSGEIYIFDYSTKEVTVYEKESNNVIATNDLYVINLCYDSVKFNDKDVLLIKNVKNLNNLK